MRILLGLAAVLLAAATFSIALAGAPPAADEATIKQLITDLGHKDAAVRDEAQKRLVEIGLPSRPALLAAAKSDDPEVRARVAATLKGIEASLKVIREAAAQKALHDCPEVTVKDLGKIPAASWLNFSPNGEHVAYDLRRGDKSVVVYDGKEGPECDSWKMGRFSADSSRYQYEMTQANLQLLVVAGHEDKPVPVEDAEREVRSPDGKRLARVVKGDDGQWVTCDGQEGPHYQSVSRVHFSPDGRRLVYTAQNAAKAFFIVIDGTPYGPCQGVGGPVVFSPDGKRYAFTARRMGKAKVVCDGKEGQAYDNVFYPIFSPDSKGLAYWTRSADLETVLIIWDETEVGRITSDAQLAFSPDSRRLAWGSWHGDAYLCPKKGQEAVRLSTGLNASSEPAFSPDSRHVAFAAGHDDKTWNVRVDNLQLGDTYDTENVMSFDSSRYGGFVLCLDPPGFSADGRHVFYKGFHGPPGNVGKGPRRHFMVIDGVAWPAHDGLWIPNDFKNHPKKLRYIVRDGDQVRLVETAWPDGLSWQEAAVDAKK